MKLPIYSDTIRTTCNRGTPKLLETKPSFVNRLSPGGQEAKSETAFSHSQIDIIHSFSARMCLKLCGKKLVGKFAFGLTFHGIQITSVGDFAAVKTNQIITG